MSRIYIAVIAVLIVVAAAAIIQAVKAQRTVKEIRAGFELPAAEPRQYPLHWATTKSRNLASARHDIDELIHSASAEFGGCQPGNSRMAAACAAAVSRGGRVRPIILMEVARLAELTSVGRSRNSAAPVNPAEAMVFIEYLHCASVVIDDTPAFDDETHRRGRPALHIEFGTAAAQMAAVALVAAAIQCICRQVDWLRMNSRNASPDYVGSKICYETGRAMGALGAAGGQLAELDTSADPADIARRKTASFFELAVVAGWLIAGGNPKQVAAARELGTSIGIAFQVADDICDAGSDATRTTANFANVYGTATATKLLEEKLRNVRRQLAQLALDSPLWEEILCEIANNAAMAATDAAAAAAAAATAATGASSADASSDSRQSAIATNPAEKSVAGREFEKTDAGLAQ